MIARTSDGGKTWTNISGDLPVNDPVETVREDPVNPSYCMPERISGCSRHLIREPAECGSATSHHCEWMICKFIRAHPIW
jgi:hypothetical protein